MKKAKLITGKAYLFEWNDTYNVAGWRTDEYIDEHTVPLTQKTVGFFVKEANGYYIVAAHQNNHEDFVRWGSIAWIPISSVVAISSL